MTYRLRTDGRLALTEEQAVGRRARSPHQGVENRVSDDQSVNEAIETYRQQLTAEAELARGDLDEIEDHMRTLIDEPRATV